MCSDRGCATNIITTIYQDNVIEIYVLWAMRTISDFLWRILRALIIVTAIC